MFLRKTSIRTKDIKLIAKIIAGIFLSISLVSCIGGSNSSASSGLSQAESNNGLDTLLQTFILQDFTKNILNKRATGDLTAISVAAQCKGNPPLYVYNGTNGFDDLTPINENSIFQVGSITKSFHFKVVMLQLIQEYGYDIDSETVIADYFPEYPKWGKITLRQLMNMTSGIPGNGTIRADDIYRTFTKDEYDNYIDPTTILNLTYKLPMDFSPGDTFEYSNTNYTLLGVLIQRITHNSVEYEVKKRIFDKLGLHHTYLPNDKLSALPDIVQSNIVHGYNFYRDGSNPYPFQKYGEDVTNFSLSYLNYAGAIASTPEDINIFVHALYTPGKLLNSSQITDLTSLVSKVDGKYFQPKDMPNQVGFGLGIFGFYSKEDDTLIYFYQGATDGFSFNYFYIPKTQMYLTVGVNSITTKINYQDYKGLLDSLNIICQK